MQSSRRKFYGRRQGHKLHPRQAALMQDVLPQLSVSVDRCDPFEIFKNTGRYNKYALEIGFGGGEHLIARARQQPDTGFIGSEVFVNGVSKLVAAVEHENFTNIRIYPDDVRDLLPCLPAASFDYMYLLYPDPWPKKRHNKRRFISPENLTELHRILKPGGAFIFASDIADYVSWALARIRQHGGFIWTARTASDWRQADAMWPGTRYEAKAIKAGRQPTYLHFQRSE
jgi:tRNA (guanine-N7-)-methyltransferase